MKYWEWVEKRRQELEEQYKGDERRTVYRRVRTYYVCAVHMRIIGIIITLYRQ